MRYLFIALLLLGFWLCRHDWQWQNNIYGDCINYSGGMRSTWQCSKCGRRQHRPYLKP